MRLLIDFFPIAIFAIAYFITKSFTTATIILIPVTTAQFFLLWAITKKADKIHLITLLLLIVFGGTTIILDNPAYLQWKPSIVNWLFAAVLLGSHLFSQKTAIEHLLDQKITLKRSSWRTLNIMWSVFFIFSGAINLYVALYFSESFWVQFKLFGQIFITLAFLIVQSIYLYYQMQDVAEHKA